MDVRDTRARLALRLLRYGAGARDPSSEVPAGAGGETMAAVAYVPTFQGLAPLDLIRRRAGHASCYPFDAPRLLYFYRARTAFFPRLRGPGPREPHPRPLRVLMPDYTSGNEIAAVLAAGASVEYYTVDRQMQIDPESIERLCDRESP